MEYKLSFIILVIITSIFGFLFGIFNNTLINKIENNIKQNEENKNIESEISSEKIDTHNDTKKNELLKKSDFFFFYYEEEKIKEKEIEENKYKGTDNAKDKYNEEAKKSETENKEEVRNKEKENEKIKKKETDAKMEEEKMHTIYLGVNIDNKYIYPFLVYITSLMDNRGPYTIYDINIITSKNLRKDYIDKINSLREKYDSKYFKLSLYSLVEDFRGAITNEHISEAAYYRISLPSLLPHVDKLIYTDLDVINFCDLTEMYNLEMKDNIYFKGVLDNPSLTRELKNLGIKVDKYMNSGILLMNLKSIRKNNIERKLRDFIKSHFLDHHDQTAINGACYNNWEILPLKFGVFAESSFENLCKNNEKQDKRYRYNEAELREAYYEPVILHYVGYSKPWDINKNKPLRQYWWYYAKKSGYYDEILSNYHCPKSEAEKLIKSIPSDGGLLRRNYKRDTLI